MPPLLWSPSLNFSSFTFSGIFGSFGYIRPREPINVYYTQSVTFSKFFKISGVFNKEMSLVPRSEKLNRAEKQLLEIESLGYHFIAIFLR